MKIWYQSLFDAGRLPAYFEGIRKRAASIARPGTGIDLHGMPEGIYGARTPAEVVVYPYLAALHGQILLDNALRAEKEGYDVFALGSVQDPMIEEARSLVDIPVVGYGESAMHFACLLGSRFVVIAFGERFDQMLDERVKRAGLSERALPTMLMDRTSFADVGKGLDDAAGLVEVFSRTARKAIALGAEAIIPGQLYLSEAIARAGVTRIDEAPIVDGLAATVKMAEAMADLRKLGISVTRRGYAHARPPKEVLEQARKFHRRNVD
jgi:allantoin racemase